ncbi:MAG: copper chaperone [Flavipsychrobacter sp.]|nr:copper chaperone [Flavipsychrobacter sp.]
MRLAVSSLLFIAAFFLGNSAFAGNTIVVRTFHVDGVCGKCKERIENAAYVKGVRFAEWKKSTGELTVKYDSTKTSPEVFLKNVAKSGHDNELFKAEEGDYGKISPCCKYRSGIKAH